MGELDLDGLGVVDRCLTDFFVELAVTLAVEGLAVAPADTFELDSVDVFLFCISNFLRQLAQERNSRETMPALTRFIDSFKKNAESRELRGHRDKVVILSVCTFKPIMTGDGVRSFLLAGLVMEKESLLLL